TESTQKRDQDGVGHRCPRQGAEIASVRPASRAGGPRASCLSRNALAMYRSGRLRASRPRMRHRKREAVRTWSAALGAALPAGGPGAHAIEGPVWRRVHPVGQGEQALADPSNAPSVRFEAGRVEGFGGCNRVAGSYAIEGDLLKLGPLAGTMMACPGPAMQVE